METEIAYVFNFKFPNLILFTVTHSVHITIYPGFKDSFSAVFFESVCGLGRSIKIHSILLSAYNFNKLKMSMKCVCPCAQFNRAKNLVQKLTTHI